MLLPKFCRNNLIASVKSAIVCIALTGSSVVFSDNHIKPSDYRTGVPPVVSSGSTSPDQSENSDGVIRVFKQAYARKNQPRIIIFWNRVVSDAVSGSAYRSTDDSMRLESGLVRVREEFISSLLDADVKLVNRSIATRKSAVVEDQRKRFSLEEPINAQTLEMLGLERLADAVVEVRPYASKHGIKQFRVQMIDTASGNIIERFKFDTAGAGDKTDRLAITDKGYEYRRAQVSPEQIGRAMAIEFMTRYSS